MEENPYYQLVNKHSICPYRQDFGHFTGKLICQFHNEPLVGQIRENDLRSLLAHFPVSYGVPS